MIRDFQVGRFKCLVLPLNTVVRANVDRKALFAVLQYPSL